jgi:hypothetical protein
MGDGIGYMQTHMNVGVLRMRGTANDNGEERDRKGETETDN